MASEGEKEPVIDGVGELVENWATGVALAPQAFDLFALHRRKRRKKRRRRGIFILGSKVILNGVLVVAGGTLAEIQG